MALSNDEVKRYSRHLIMPEVGVDGQEKLKSGSVLCIGAGGLGSPAALYLAAAGVGRIGIVDFDVVDFSNLQRQVIHSTPDVGRSKLASAKDRLLALNPHVTIETYETALSSKNALDLFRPYDVILDGTDNFPTRYLTNDACVILGKPNAYGSIFRFEGQASVFATKGGPCYRCLYPEPPPPGLVPSCAEGGVLGVLPGVIGTIQATEAIKLITGIGEPLIGRFLIYDALRMKFRELKLKRDPDCPVCGTNPTVTELIDYEQFCGVAPAAPEVAVNTSTNNETETDVRERSDERRRHGRCDRPAVAAGALDGWCGALRRRVDVVAHHRVGSLRSVRLHRLVPPRTYTRVGVSQAYRAGKDKSHVEAQKRRVGHGDACRPRRLGPRGRRAPRERTRSG